MIDMTKMFFGSKRGRPRSRVDRIKFEADLEARVAEEMAWVESLDPANPNPYTKSPGVLAEDQKRRDQAAEWSREFLEGVARHEEAQRQRWAKIKAAEKAYRKASRVKARPEEKERQERYSNKT